jgi:hypothetical protein
MSENDNLHIRMTPGDLAELKAYAAEDSLPASALARTWIKAAMRSRRLTIISTATADAAKEKHDEPTL